MISAWDQNTRQETVCSLTSIPANSRPECTHNDTAWLLLCFLHGFTLQTSLSLIYQERLVHDSYLFRVRSFCLFQHFFPSPFWLSASSAALLSPSITTAMHVVADIKMLLYFDVLDFPSHPTFATCLQLVFAYMQQPVQLLVCHLCQEYAHVGNFLVES